MPPRRTTSGKADKIADPGYPHMRLLLDLRCRAEYVCLQIHWARSFFRKHRKTDEAILAKVDALLAEAELKATEAHVLLQRVR